MKIQLDTNAKTIKVEEDVNLSELISKLKKLLPKGEWKEYTLQSNTTIQWYTYPYIIYNYNKPFWQQPIVTYDTNSLNIKSDGGTLVNETITYSNTSGDIHYSANVPAMDNKGIYNIQL